MYKKNIPLLLGAGKNTTIYVGSSSFIRIESATASFRARLEDEDIGYFKGGDWLRVGELSAGKLFIENNNDFEINISLDVSSGDIGSDSLVLNGSISAITNGGNSIKTYSSSLTQVKKKIVDLEVKRSRVGFHNIGTEIVLLGGSDVTNANGWYLEPSEKMFLDVSSEIWAKCLNDVVSEIRIIESTVENV